MNSTRKHYKNVVIYTEGGTYRGSHLELAPECIKHSLIYDGCTIEKLNTIFNEYRLDIRYGNSSSTELTDHFVSNGCSFKKDLKGHVHRKYSESTPLSLFRVHEEKYVCR